MSNINPNADENPENKEEFVEHIPDPITPETNPEEFEQINNVTDKAQSPTNKRLLGVSDEFTNDKSNLLIRYFHAAIKKHLKDPEKRFLLLVNKDINQKEWLVNWSNDPSEEGKTFVAFDMVKDITNFKMGNPTVDNSIPKPIKPYDAYATDYKTDEDGTQHFPTECLKFNNKNYWYSDTRVEQLESQTRLISFRFRTSQIIKYFCINFHLPDKVEQVFDIIYETNQYDEKTGNPKAVLAFANVKNLMTDGLQIIEFEEPILTKGISLRYKSPIGAINYVFVLDKELSDAQLNMFLDVNSNSDLDNKAFNNTNGN